jgi:hypothetical protein
MPTGAQAGDPDRALALADVARRSAEAGLPFSGSVSPSACGQAQPGMAAASNRRSPVRKH